MENRPSRPFDPSEDLRGVDRTVIAALALCLGLATTWLIPLDGGFHDPSCAPDELVHFGYVSALASGRFDSWPAFDNRMAMFPPGQYLFQTLGLLVGQAGRGDAGADTPALHRFPPNDRTFEGFSIARLGSVLLGVLAVVCLADAAAVVASSRSVGVFAGLIAALYPQRFFQFGYINNDAFAFACGALVIASLARWARSGEGAKNLVLIAFACGLLIFAKPTGYAFLVPTLLWVSWAVAHRRIPWPVFGKAIAVMVAVCLPMLAWNAARNGGDPLGVWVYRDFVASESWRGSKQLMFPPQPVLVFFRSLASSSFMKFGNNNLHLPAWLYVPWLLTLLLGLPAFLRQARSADAMRRRMAAWLGASLALAFGAIVYQCLRVDFSPQGRYVILATVTLTLVCCNALEEMCSARWRGSIRLGLLTYFSFTAVWSLWLLWQHPCGPPG